MKGVKIGIVGICVSLVGMAFATNHIVAICASLAGLLFSVAGCFVKEK